MTVDAFAAALIEARRTRTAIPAAEAERLAAGLGLDGAFAVQTKVAASIGAPIAWKAAPAAGDTPTTFAPIYDVRPSGTTFAADELTACGIELEIAFRIDAPLPAFIDAGSVLDVVTILPAIEVLDGRTVGFAEASPVVKLADFAINGGLVIGPASATGVDVTRPDVRLAFDRAVVLEGVVPPPGGDALATLVEFLRAVGDHCGGVKVGQIVTTGALGGPRFVPAGTSVAAEIASLGAVAMDYA